MKANARNALGLRRQTTRETQGQRQSAKLACADGSEGARERGREAKRSRNLSCRDMCVRAVPASGVRGYGVDALREPGHQHGCGEAVPGDAGGRRALVGSPVAATHTRVGIDRASAWGAGRRGVFPQCGVGHAWALGLVRRPVALSGLLRRSPSGP
jgi:hypothetical protein